MPEQAAEDPSPGSVDRNSEAPGSFAEIMRADNARGAELRNSWRQSPARQRFIVGIWAYAIAVALATALVWLVVRKSGTPETGELRGTLFAFGTLATGAYLGAIVFVVLRRQQRGAWYDRVVLPNAQAALREAEDAVDQEKLDLLSLWKATQRRLDYYHRIATNQAEKSFTYGVVAAALGFLVLIGTSVGVGLADSTAASIAAGITGIGGAGLAGYIGSTFLRLQESSAAQLRAYFSQPLDFSRYLAAERLLELLSLESREAATRDMVKGLLRTQGGASDQND